jgi:hypothetical protein
MKEGNKNYQIIFSIVVTAFLITSGYIIIKETPQVTAETFTPPNVRVDDSLLDDNDTAVPAMASWGANTLYIAYAQDFGISPRIIFARSLDSGNTWEGFTNVSDEGMGFGYVTPPDIAVAPNGTIYVVWFEERFFNNGIYISWSSDGGLTWGDGLMNSNDVQIENATDQIEDPTIGILDNGTISVVWTAYHSGFSTSEINTTFSYDGGLTWTAPVRANDDPIWTNDHDRPDAAVVGNTMHLVWRDDRNPGPDQIYWASWSGSWSPNVRVDDAPGGVDADAAAIVAGIGGDPNSLGVVYIDDRSSEEELYYTNSSDGGLNWGDGVPGNDVQLSYPTVIGNFVERPRLIDLNGKLVAAWTDDAVTAPGFNDTDILTASSADGITWTPPSRANDDEIDSYFDQSHSSLATLPGMAFVAYTTQHEGNGDIALTWSTDGMIWGDGYTNDNDVIAVGLGTLNGGEQWDPQLVEFGGSFYSVWADSRDIDFTQPWPYLGNDNLYFSSSSDGIVWGDGSLNNNDIRVDDGTKFSNANSPDLAVNAGGRLYVAYTDDRNGDNDTFVTWSDDGGQIWGDGHINGNDVRVNDDTMGNGMEQFNPVIAVAPNGTIFIAWEDLRNGNSDIFVGVSIDGGSSWSNFGPVNDDPGSARQLNPAIAVTNSAVYVVWEDHRSGNEDIYFSVSLDGGMSWSINARVDDDLSGTSQMDPTIIVDSLGIITVAWVDNRSVGNPPDIASTNSPDGGTTWGDGILNGNDILVNDPGSSPAMQGGPSLAADTTTFAVFHDDRNGGTPDVFFSKFNSSSVSWSSPDDQVNDPLFESEIQDSPEIVIDSTTVSVIWRDGRLGSNNIWFHRTVREGAASPSPLDRIELSPWPGPTNLVISQGQLYTAFGYNLDGSLNLTWTPSWGMTDGFGALGNFGGSAGSGYTVEYTASTEGSDNITITDTILFGITNQSLIDISSAPAGSPLGRIELTPWPGPTGLLVSQLQSYTALGYNEDESLNLTWSASWGTTNGLGTLGNFGGAASSGFTVDYTASTPGLDNVKITDAVLTTITNQSQISISSPPINDPLTRIELTPWPSRTLVTGENQGFTAIGYSQSGAKNLSWTPSWSANLGTITGAGGDANNGYTVTYNAPTTPGSDNFSVSNNTITNSTSITINVGPVDRIELTPWPSTVLSLPGSKIFLAGAFDAEGNLNITWSPNWVIDEDIGTLGSESEPSPGSHQIKFIATTLGFANVTVSDPSTSISNSTMISISDSVPPQSEIEPVTSPSTSLTLTLSYTASDSGGSGIKEVEIWYRLNEGTWTLHDTLIPWIDGTISFTASGDGTWDFYSIARDNVSNEESPPDMYDIRVIVDSIPSGLIDSTPKDGDDNISPTDPITLTFSEAMNQSSVEDAVIIEVNGKVVPGTWSWNGNVATFTPIESFPQGEEVKVHLDGTIAMNLEGEPLGESEDFTFSTSKEKETQEEFPLWILLLLLLIIVLIVLFLIFGKKKGNKDDNAPEVEGEGQKMETPENGEADDLDLNDVDTEGAEEGREINTQDPEIGGGEK